VADEKGRRPDAATGIAAVIFWVVGFLLPGAPPKVDDSTQQITSFFIDKRGELLAGDFLIVLGSVAFLWWLGSLRSYLRSAEGGEGRLSAAAFGGGIAGVALLIAGVCVFSAAVFKVASLGDAVLNRALFDTGGFLVIAAGAGFAITLGAASCSAARSGALPPWLFWLGSVAAAAQLLTLIGLFAESGFLAGGGAFAIIAFFIAAIWVVATSVVIMQRNGMPPVARTPP
jgi:hypothetical protein